MAPSLRAATLAVLALLLAGLPASPASPASPAPGAAATPALREALLASAPEETLGVLVTFHESSAEAGRMRLGALGVPAAHLRHLPVSAASLPATMAESLLAWSEVRRVHLDVPLRFDLNRSAPAVGAPRAWHDLGETGRNVTVMVIDTGLDATHPDFHGRATVLTASPSPGAPPVQAPVTDGDGHGTHVAGIVAGDGAALGPGVPLVHRRFVGVAPEARLVSFGVGAAGKLFQALQGFDWALAHHASYGIRVVSNSWSVPGGGVGGGYAPDGEVEQAALRLYRAGVAVVFAAGNAGPEPNTLNPLAMPPWVLAVGAATSGGGLADFSARGVDAGAALTWSHPDLVAPGTGVMSARAAATSNADRGPAYCPDATGFPADQLGLVPAEHDGARVAASVLYTCASGTSMATPHVAGALALMASANPALSPDQLYDLVLATATLLPRAPWEAGAGYLDARAAVAAARAALGQRAAFLAGQHAYGGASCPEDDALARLLHARGLAPAPCTAPGNAAPFAPWPYPGVACTGLPGLPAVPGPQAAVVGQPVVLGIFGVVDFEGGPVRLRVDWGDGVDLQAPPSAEPEACLVHTYAAAGTYLLAVRGGDDAGAWGPPRTGTLVVAGTGGA